MTQTEAIRLAKRKGYLVIVPGLGSRNLALENEWFDICKRKNRPYLVARRSRGLYAFEADMISCDQNFNQSAVRQFHYVMQRMEHRRTHEWFLGVECLSSNRIRLDENQLARVMEWLMSLCRHESVSHTTRDGYDSGDIEYPYSNKHTWAKYFRDMKWSDSLDELLAHGEVDVAKGSKWFRCVFTPDRRQQPSLRLGKYRKRYTVAWSEGSYFHYPELREALADYPVCPELKHLWILHVDACSRNTTLMAGGINGMWSGLSEWLALRVFETMKAFFTKAMADVERRLEMEKTA